MGKPVDFPESNLTLKAPEGMPNCRDMKAYRGHQADGQPVVIELWEFTEEELAEIAKTKRVYLSVYGHGIPPIAVYSKNPFVYEESETDDDRATEKEKGESRSGDNHSRSDL